MNKDFHAHYHGKFVSALRWKQLDRLWLQVRQTPNDWYVYLVGQDLPTQRTDEVTFNQFIDEINVLLRSEHDHDFCGIVYADDFTDPTMVKIFDPSHLGSSCGACGYTVYPRWLLSKTPPQILEDTAPLPNNRRRWWQKIFK